MNYLTGQITGIRMIAVCQSEECGMRLKTFWNEETPCWKCGGPTVNVVEECRHEFGVAWPIPGGFPVCLDCNAIIVDLEELRQECGKVQEFFPVEEVNP